MKRTWLAMMVGTISLLLLSPVRAQSWLSFAANDCAYGGNFAAVEAVDRLTVRVTLCQPDPAFLFKIAFSAFAITPSEYLQATGGSGELLRRPIGTGPYRLERWEAGRALVLRRNEQYWGQPAFEPELIIRWAPEASERLKALQSGEVDGIDNPAAEDFDVIEGDPNLALYERPSTNVFYLGINNTVPPFDNVLVRQAVAYAINRQAIVNRFYPAGSIVARQFMPPSIFGYTEEVIPFGFDPDRARQLLQQAEVTLPVETTLSYSNTSRSYLPQPTQIAEAIRQQLAAVGINATLQQQEWNTFLDDAEAGRLALHLLGWGADYPDATNFLDFHFGIGSSPQFGQRLGEITGPLQEAARLGAQAERYPLYVKANTAIRDLVPMVPIAHAASGTAFRADIRGAHSSPLSSEYFPLMEDLSDDTLVWMQGAEPNSLYCADEEDGESLRACEQISEPLLTYEISGTRLVPALARSWESNYNATEWTLRLRDGVMFHDGSALDANDVVLTFAVQWDAASPLHTGRTGSFTYFSAFFGGFLNAES